MNQEEIGNLNRPISCNNIEAVIKYLPKKQEPRTWRIHLGILPNFQKEITPILLKLFQKIEAEGKLPNPFYESSITLIPNQAKDPT